MIIVASRNAAEWLPLGMELLRSGRSALEAVEAVIREVESDIREHSVGVGGLPNLLGEVELDASIMQGCDRRSGAVGAVQRYAHPISIARKVMELTPHVFLVGRGAEDFAREIGMNEETTLRDEAAGEWAARLLANVRLEEMPALLARKRLLPYVLLARDPERIHGTVNVLARDSRGDLASGVSTSGWAWKYPGRLGDSPVIGAGNYCDNRYGAAACTGHGEVALRASLARSIMMHLEYGAGVEEASDRALQDAPAVPSHEGGVLIVVAMDREGRHTSVTNAANGGEYAWMAEGMSTAEIAPSRRLSSA